MTTSSAPGPPISDVDVGAGIGVADVADAEGCADTDPAGASARR
jgi:hypothetical protein